MITGATGFIGKELAKELLANGYEVNTLERYVTGRYGLDQNSNLIRHYANLTDFPAIKKIVKAIQPEYTIHLGSISAVSFSYENYIEVSDVNYLGTIGIAEACYREVPGFKQFIFAGTSEEYGTSLKTTNEYLKEDSMLEPNSPYAISKVACDYYMRYMGKAYAFPYTILRPFNTYGRCDNKHFFIERTITQMLKQDKVYLGDPETARDWLYVKDHVAGYLKTLGNSKAIGETIQLCTGKAYTTKETAEKIAALTEFKGEIVWHATPERPLDGKILVGDNSKAAKLLDWTPKYTLEEGLKESIAYWRTK